MAYDALNPGTEDEDEKQSQYATLLAPAAPMANGGVVSGVQPPTSKPQSGSGFVNFDRVLNANRSALDRMHADTETKLSQPLETAKQGIKQYETQATSAAKSGALQAPMTAAATQAQALSPDKQYAQGQQPIKNADRTYEAAVAPVTQAQGAMQRQYSGPSAQDAASKYAELLTPTGPAASAVSVAANGNFDGLNEFDSQLMAGSAGGRYKDLKSQYDALMREAGDSAGRVNEAIGNAQGTYQSGSALEAWKAELARAQAAEAERQAKRAAPTTRYIAPPSNGGPDTTRTVNDDYSRPLSAGEKEYNRLLEERVQRDRLKKEEERARWLQALRGII